MSGVTAPEIIIRPNGRLYRPRKVVGNAVSDEDGFVTGIVVLGTHDVERAKKLADSCAAGWAGCGFVAARPEMGWFRLGFEAGELVWLTDETQGRAGVMFREITEARP